MRIFALVQINLELSNPASGGTYLAVQQNSWQATRQISPGRAAKRPTVSGLY